jgi:predicted nucleic acid-binding protein
MIAADTSVWIALLQGEDALDVHLLRQHMVSYELTMPPAVLTELSSLPTTLDRFKSELISVIDLEITDGFWDRAGITRGKILTKGLKANLGDALIAQSCIDHNIPLLTRDVDFKHFQKHCGLKLVAYKSH